MPLHGCRVVARGVDSEEVVPVTISKAALLDWLYERYVMTTAEQYLRLIREIESGRFDHEYGPAF